jgi:toxin ParE1/3/4
MKIKWTPTAARHLEALEDYIAQDNPSAAYRVAQTIRKQIEMLILHPYSGRTGRVEGTRELVISKTPYIVAYAVSENNISILAVLHHSRKWPDAFNELTEPKNT